MEEKKSPATEKPTMIVNAAIVAEKTPASEKPPLPPGAQVALPNQTMTAASPAPVPAFTKAAPHDLYRRLLPAALFLLTFVTVMTMLLMYMDTTALRAQQFRVNMTHDYELSRIAQDDPSLVAYVRQLHLGVGPPRRHAADDAAPADEAMADDAAPQSSRIQLLAAATNNKYNGTFVEVAADGPRDAAAAWLRRARGWRGLVVRADPRDYFAARAAATPRVPALHACLSTGVHPKEVTYYESRRTWKHDGVSVDAPTDGTAFSSRVLCFPLYTMLLVGRAARCDYLLLAGPGSRRALATVPFHAVHIELMEIRMTGDTERNATTEFLLAKGYQVKGEVDDSVFYVRRPDTKV